MTLTSRQIVTLKASGLAARILSEPGVAGELQRLFVLYPQCPKRANALVRLIYERRDEILGALRLAEA